MILFKRWLKKWRSILPDLVSTLGFFWLIVEITSYFTNNTIDHYLKNTYAFSFVIVVSVLVSILINKPKICFDYQLRGKDNSIEVRVSDAFENKGALIVPVNNEFDMSLGGNVEKAKSIQNQLIQKYYKGKVEHLNTDISKQCKIGEKHDIGKTIEVEQSGKKFYLTVNSKKEENNRVKSEINDFIQALNGLWEYVALESGRNESLTIPLINTQHGRDSYMTRMGAAKEIITSFIEASKSLNICEKLILSIHPNDLAKNTIDLDELDDFLRFSCRHYRQVTAVRQSEDPNSDSKVIGIEN